MYPLTHDFDNCTLTETLFSMHDGISLYTRLLVPKGDAKCPIVFIRTPYAPASGSDPKLDSNLEAPFAEAGYAVVLQHCRGTGNSEGICIPYHERSDGLDTLALIRKLPFYNGEIYLYGMSYLATVHFSYLDPCPPDIKGAALSIQTDRMFFRNYRNGCCYDFCNLGWWLGMMKRQYPEGRAKAETTPLRPYRNLTENIDCEDTAFFIRVYFVEEGESYNLTDTITSLSHADPDRYAGKAVTLELDTPPIAFTLKKGARIRVDISSHSDIYVPHANVKGHWAEVTETKTAHNTLHLKDACITLPVSK